MKCLAIILSIYLLALNIVPCVDNIDHSNDVKTEISFDIDGESHNESSDLCSPFCQCQCCQIQATKFIIDDYALIASDYYSDLFPHINGIEKGFNPSLLQPPQV